MDISYELDYPQFPQGKLEELHLLLTLETWPQEAKHKRKPLNLALVIDRSGSMEGEKLRATKKAATALVNKLRKRDLISLIAYDSQVELICGPISGDQKEVLNRHIANISAKGCTNLSGGWMRGLRSVLKNLSSDYIHRVMVMTDGLANEGILALDQLCSLGKEYWKNYGIATTTLGFGEDFNENHLLEIAKASGGRFYYIQGPEKALSIFMEEFGNLMRLIGQNLEIKIKNLYSTSPPQVYGEFQKEYSQNQSLIFFGDLFEDDRKQVLLKWKIDPQTKEGRLDLGSCEITYDGVMGTIGPKAHTLDFYATILSPKEPLPDPNLEVLREKILYRISEAKMASLNLEILGDISEAAKILENIAWEIKSYSHPDLVKDLEPYQEELLSLARQISTQKSQKEVRKTLLASTYSQTQHLGIYQKKPKVYEDAFSITPSNKEKVWDLIDKYQKIARDFGHSTEFGDTIATIIFEIMDHLFKQKGQKWRQSLVFLGSVKMSKNYFKITGKTKGIEVDFQKALREEKGKIQSGLKALEKMGVIFTFEENGKQITALLSQKGFFIEKKKQPYLSKGAVGAIWLILVEGNLDTITTDRFRETIQSLLKEEEGLIAIDLSKVPYVSSSGIGALIEAAENCSSVGSQLFLIGLKKNLSHLLEILGLTQFFQTFSSFEKLLQYLERSQK